MPPPNSFLSRISPYSRVIFFFLSLLAGIIFLSPWLDFQTALSQGDHGRDLYAFERALHGDLPYRDYWWVYGPLMPYYYGLFIKLLGTNIVSVLFAKLILMLVSGMLIYLSLSLWISPAMSFLGTLWFWNFYEDFFFTYNHTGGITLLLGAVYFLCAYLKTAQDRQLIFSLACLFLLSMVKINIGLAALTGFLISLPVADCALRITQTAQKKRIYLAAFLMPIVLLGTYILLSWGLTVAEIRQCFPYLKGDQPYEVSWLTAFRDYATAIIKNIGSSWPNAFFAFILAMSFLNIVLPSSRKNIHAQDLRKIWLTLGVLALFFALQMHEFLVSGVLYRSFWARPFQILMLFLIIGTGCRSLPKSVQAILGIAILTIVVPLMTLKYQTVQSSKNPHQYLPLTRAKVFTGNSPEWLETVTATTQYLEQTIPAAETFFALPYDPLYYFLTGKASPTRQLIFFEHIKIPLEQEEKIIAELEEKHINFILLSSRAASPELGLGVLGKTYCPALGRYIEENFEPVSSFGDWIHIPEWGRHHGTKILRRK